MLPPLQFFVKEYSILQAYIPGFIAGFQIANIVGIFTEKEDKNAPVWHSVLLENIEVVGSGTLATDENGDFSPFFHSSPR